MSIQTATPYFILNGKADQASSFMCRRSGQGRLTDFRFAAGLLFGVVTDRFGVRWMLGGKKKS